MARVDYTYFVTSPFTRIRTVITKTRGDVDSFLVCLEYNVSEKPLLDASWEGIARFDHNPASETGHDVRKEGLHMDIHVPNGRDRRSWDFPEVPLNEAPQWCQNYLEENETRIAKEFCYCYGFDNWDQPMNR